MVYNITDALGTLGPLARDCYEASDASSSNYRSYVPEELRPLLASIRMNIILHYLDINTSANILWGAIPDLDYGTIAYHVSRITYYVVVNGDETVDDEQVLMARKNKKLKAPEDFIYERDLLGLNAIHY